MTTNTCSCVLYGKSGLFTCRGCLKDFCIPDAIKHRQTLCQEMDQVILDHDQLRQMITEYTTEPHQHSLLKHVDAWEQKSLNEIHQVADNARRQILMHVKEHTLHIKKALEHIKLQLSKAHEDENFFENDIEQWKKKLDTMKKELLEPIVINDQHKNKMNILIPRMIFDVNALNDFFNQSIGDIQIEDDGVIIVHGQIDTQAAVRNKDEYSWGMHRFRFKIEVLGKIKWVLFGIISKDAPLQEESYLTPSSYGWAGGSQVYVNGVNNEGFGEYKSDFQADDTIELLLDCDRRTIHLTNERTGSVYNLCVDETKCSLPWQLNLNLYNKNDRVRILTI